MIDKELADELVKRLNDVLVGFASDKKLTTGDAGIFMIGVGLAPLLHGLGRDGAINHLRAVADAIERGEDIAMGRPN